MKANGLFSSDQSGFLRLHSTLTCLLKILMTGTMAGTLDGLWD